MSYMTMLTFFPQPLTYVTLTPKLYLHSEEQVILKVTSCS